MSNVFCNTACARESDDEASAPAQQHLPVPVFYAEDKDTREPFEAFWSATFGTPVPSVDFDSKQVLIVIGTPRDIDVDVRSVARVERDELFLDILLTTTDAIVPGEAAQTAFVALEVDRSTGSFSTLVEQQGFLPGG